MKIHSARWAATLALIGFLACTKPRSAEAQSAVPAQERRGFAAIQESDLRADLTFLSSDSMGGRMSLQPGDDAAAAWVASEFAKAGLAPAATSADGSPTYLQAVPLVQYRPDRDAFRVALTRSGITSEWTAKQAFGAYKSDIDLSAPVVFAGFGITAPELGYDDYKGLDASGKIVLIFDHEPQETDAKSIFNGTGNTRYATSRVKVLNAQVHGAVAVLIVAEPNRKHLTNLERQARIGGSATRTNPLPLQAIADDEIHIPLVTLLQDGLAVELMSISGTTPSAAQAVIDRQLTAQSRVLPNTVLKLHMRNLSKFAGTASNVAGLLLGSDPKLAAETVLISGHHDHDGQSPRKSAETMHEPLADSAINPGAGPATLDIWHGADDNGSGTVGVVALAHAFAANGVRPKRSILFVVFASEERGLLGSYWMAAHPLRPLSTTRAMINFDMIGRNETASPQTDGLIKIPADTTNRLNLIGALYSPDYDRVVKAENKAVGLVLDDRFDHESALNVFFRSDQFPFVLHDVPAFWFFTGFHPDYHHVTDTADKINYVKMAQILRLAYLTAWRFGEDAKPPRFIQNPAGAAASSSVHLSGHKHRTDIRQTV